MLTLRTAMTSVLTPTVGVVGMTSSKPILWRMVVLRAASSPTMHLALALFPEEAVPNSAKPVTHLNINLKFL